MKKTKKYLTPLLAAALALGLLTGCGKTQQASSGSAAAQTDETITIACCADIGDMNPHLANAGIYAQNDVFDGLVKYADGKVQPALAEKWDVSSDGLTYTFHLRRGVKYSDGSVFNANSVKKNFDAIFQNAKKFTWLGVVANLDYYEATDENTFTMVLKAPYYPALQDLAAVRPFRMLGDAGFADDGSSMNGIKAPIGTGPWMLKDYVENQYATFVQNPNYWGEKPHIAGFTIKIYTDGQSAVSALEAGQVNMIYDKKSNSFSGGQLQRICIARAVAAQPALVVLDEPLSSLDVSIQAQILNLLRDLKQAHNLTYVLISHDLEAVYYLADRLTVLYYGRVLEEIEDISFFNRLCHPYTLELLRAANYEAAVLETHIDRRTPVPEEGCPYAPRCPQKSDRCTRETPELSSVEPGHRAACFFPEG